MHPVSQPIRETRDMAINSVELPKKERRPSPSSYSPENFEQANKQRKGGKPYKYNVSQRRD